MQTVYSNRFQQGRGIGWGTKMTSKTFSLHATQNRDKGEIRSRCCVIRVK